MKRVVEKKTVFAIAVGGALGASMRLLVGFAFGAFPVDASQVVTGPSAAAQLNTLAVNVAGSALLGWLIAEMGNPSASDVRWHRLLVAASTGFCGSFTTFSTFALIVAEHLTSGQIVMGVLYGTASLALGLLAALLGGRLRRGMLDRKAARAAE